MSSQVTLTGRLTRDPELRYSAKGTAVATFAVVTSERRKNDQTQEWEDKNTTFWDCVSFGQLAESCAESLTKGTAVVVCGRAYQEDWEDREGNKRKSLKVTADDVAPSLRWASAKISRTERRTQGFQQTSDDPWATGQPAGRQSLDPRDDPSGFDSPPPF